MSDRLDELKGTIKTGVGRVIGNRRLELGGQADSVLARARRKTKGVLRQVSGALREGVGQVTNDARLEAGGKSDRLRGEAERRG
jgi:uncharacterized protein YjbJ (UPF0337 family)